MEVLKSKEGMWFTNGETFSKEVFIGRTGNVNSWWEITEAEKEQIESEKLPIEGEE